MSQPPYGQGPELYQQHPDQGGYGAPPQGGGYGPAPQDGYGTPPYGQGGYPGAGPHGPPQAPKSKTGVIIAAIVGVLAIGGIILAVVLVNATPSPSALVQGDDPALNQLAQSCFDGEMAACDDLFLQSPVDSDYEQYGNTCGGRVEEDEVDQRYCVDIF